MEGAAREIHFGHLDVGPTDSLPPDELLAVQSTFFGPLLSSDPSKSGPSCPTTPSLRELSPPPPSAAEPTSSHPIRHPAGNSATRKRKLQSRSRRENERREENAKKPRYGENGSVMLKHVASASSTPTLYDVSQAPVASTGFIALPDSRGSVHTLDHLIGKLGFRYIEATEG